MDLKKVRLEMDLTQAQLAKKAKLSIRTINRAEHTQPGQGNFTERTVSRLCRAYNISPEEVEQVLDLLLVSPEDKPERTQKR